MNAVALVESVDHVCVRYRLTAFQTALHDHTLHIEPFAPKLFARLKQYQSLASYDAVILQRSLLSSFELRVLRANAKRLIFDFDDAIWLRDSYSMKGRSRKRETRFANVISQADHVIAGNDFLAAEAASFTPRLRVRTLPTCIAVDDYPQALHDRSDALALVWVGSSSTLASLEAMRPTLEAIGKTLPNITLKIICDRFIRFDPLKVTCVPWSAATEAEQIASADIGIAVMPDDDWSRGKCGVKVLQYLAAGLPVLANPVGVHEHMVRPAKTGFHAHSTAEWIAMIRHLHDPELRREMGAEGRRLVADGYSTAAGAAAWCSLFDGFAQRQAC